MANPIFYYDGLEDATLVYSATEDAGFTVENLKNRNKNTFFKDSGIGAASVNIVIDFGVAKSCDSIMLGNFLATSADAAQIKVEAHSADVWVGAQTVALSVQLIDTSSLTDTAFSFSAQNFRYWRILFSDISAGNLTNLQFAIILLGTKLSHTVRHNWTMFQGWLSNVGLRGTKGGQSFANKNGANKRVWALNWEDIEETHKGNMLTWIDTVCNNYLPFYLDVDGDGTEYLVRKQGVQGGVIDKDFQVYDSDRITVVEEI